MAPMETPKTNGASTPNLDVEFKVPQGVLVPPPHVRVFIEKTAEPVSRNGKAFEQRIKDQHGSKPQFTFLYSQDPYFNYYEWRVKEIAQGRMLDDAGRAITKKQAEKPKGLEKPPEFEFSARMPPINALDLDVLHHTARFVAIHGRGFLMGLSQREAGNPQFDFLRSTHSYNQYFNRMVDQYTELRNARTLNDGAREKERIDELTETVKDKFTFLEKAKKRAEWVKHQEKEKQKKEEKEEEDKVAYAQIDWLDFYVAETIVFPEDEDPAGYEMPTTIGQLQALSLEQKAAISVVNSNMRIEEALPGDFDTPPYSTTPHAITPQPVQAYQPPQPAYVPQPIPTPVQTHIPPSFAQQIQSPPFTPSPPPLQSAAPGQTRPAVSSPAPVPVGAAPPRGLAARRRAQVTKVPCPNCGQQIPADELEAHIRIELQDPKWREQKAKSDARFSTTNLHSVDVANNLKRLASHRDDIFDPVTGEPITEEEIARRKKVAANLVVQVPDQDDVGRTVKVPMGQTMDINEQIKNIQARYKGHQNGE